MSMRVHEYARDVSDSTLNRLRIVKVVDEAQYEYWQLDGVLVNLGDPDGPVVVGWSADYREYPSWREAVDDIPSFVEDHGLTQFRGARA